MTTNGGGQLGFNTDVTGWTNQQDGGGDNGYNFLYTPGSADTTGAPGVFGSVSLWGPNNGSNNGLPATSPDGGNFVAMDGAFETVALTQQINGLTVGQIYALTFFWGGVQQQGFTGPTTEGFVVGLGDLTQNTSIVSNDSHGFSGWQSTTLTFMADQVNPVLSFLAVGTPMGEPPFTLLDGVDLEAVPEPATFALIGLGLLALPIVARRRNRTR